MPAHKYRCAEHSIVSECPVHISFRMHPAGIEPALPESESGVLSIRLRLLGHSFCLKNRQHMIYNIKSEENQVPSSKLSREKVKKEKNAQKWQPRMELSPYIALFDSYNIPWIAPRTICGVFSKRDSIETSFFSLPLSANPSTLPLFVSTRKSAMTITPFF